MYYKLLQISLICMGPYIPRSAPSATQLLRLIPLHLLRDITILYTQPLASYYFLRSSMFLFLYVIGNGMWMTIVTKVICQHSRRAREVTCNYIVKDKLLIAFQKNGVRCSCLFIFITMYFHFSPIGLSRRWFQLLQDAWHQGRQSSQQILTPIQNYGNVLPTLTPSFYEIGIEVGLPPWF